MIKLINQKTKLKSPSAEEQEAGENVMKNCMAVKPDEKVLIVTDEKLVQPEAAIFFESAKKFTNNVSLVQFPATGEHTKEPPQKVADLMKQADVALLVTYYSLTHTLASHIACDSGCRIASMPTITQEMILRTLTMDYNEVANLSKKIAGILTAGKKALITNASGTNLFLSLTGRTAIADTGFYTNAGDKGNLPAGEAFIAPFEGTADGSIVFEGTVGENILTEEKITVTVRNGKAVNIEGGEIARILLQRISAIGEKAFNIAEFGIGTNKKALLGKSILEVEKIYGTCHIALGNNAHFGGEVDVPFHEDGLILSPTITIDDRVIMKEGRFVF